MTRKTYLVPDSQKFTLTTRINRYFDVDASPETFEFFTKVYSTQGIFKEFDFEHLKFHNGQFSRLSAKLKADSPLRADDKFGPKFLITGDTDFNFKPEKVNVLASIVNSDVSGSQKEKDDIFSLLFECAGRYHSLRNFSIMPQTGGMNNAKGQLRVGKEGIDFTGGLKLDRLDTFIAALNKFYAKRNSSGNQLVLGRATVQNKSSLENYLNSFCSIYDYCEQVLLINDNSFFE